VIATGRTTEVRDFVRKAFEFVGIELSFTGSGIDEKAVVARCHNPEFQLEKGKCVLEVDPVYFRPTEVDLLLGDSSKAKKELGWEPVHTLEELIKDMMAADLKLMQKEQYLKNGGFNILNNYE
jgi:GDPmannose 4,6-dehydratase